ncbi:MAG: ZIP family metal transporter [Clostridia bacterium]|nr:ZIP family metal transporter [Clostridia bacterium]
MEIVFLTALGVGFSTILGGIIGFFANKSSHKFNDAILSFAAGVMLLSSVTGLILPSLELGGDYKLLITILGVLCGAFVLDILDRLIPQSSYFLKMEKEQDKERSRAILFVLAIAIHNLPEGIATGVAFGTDDIGQALTVAIGIALQNVPEGMIVIPPMLSVGYSKAKALGIAFFTGFIEIVGTMLGYFAVSVASVILPFALAFAGGTMLYLISDEMIPETHSHGNERVATFALLVGFSIMLIFDALL